MARVIYDLLPDGLAQRMLAPAVDRGRASERLRALDPPLGLAAALER